MPKAIELKGVSWRRGDSLILQDIDWTVEEGQHWAVLGLNGSGKSSILNIISGYMWPTTGEVSVLGHKFGTIDLRELRKSIGWVSSSLQEKIRPNEQALEIVISGRHASIGLYAEIEQADREKAHALMNDLGCSHLIGRTYQTCSQGEKQKLLIARALMASPKLLILDEASNGLDFISREALLQSIDALAVRPDAPTLLLVTHHTEEVSPVFSHSLLIRRGRIFAQGESKKILNDEKLSEFFEMPVGVDWRGGRAWLSVR
ncbi:molybdenum ABC transporter ATP-binding protein [Saccharibacillus sp. O23]|uniref:ABC transporter ATP-binding protein n=1 Tax=Saccharibacillus sp. O23 TaxID=2009338 RepID=UPI000B4E1DDB|nr:ABC transporter ATP-binding protein [Saccharibacillus sp. O23]OWR27188.1 molybdenum ABC transporter ATP-binding protein [Saccharibacillus sp. O23]